MNSQRVSVIIVLKTCYYVLVSNQAKDMIHEVLLAKQEAPESSRQYIQYFEEYLWRCDKEVVSIIVKHDYYLS